MEINSVDKIRKQVYYIRGQQVMLDVDLAEIYGYEVKKLNQQVKRNINRFPEDFMFQISLEELENLRSQFVTTKINSKSRSLPYAFTEQGIYMLATVLRGELAEQQSIFIMRAFKEMRHYIIANQQFVSREEWDKFITQQKEICLEMINIKDEHQQLKASMDLLENNFICEKDLKNFVIYKGQKFEADVAYIDIYQQAQNSIYVIDNYMNTKTLQLLSQKKDGVAVALFTENERGEKGFLTKAVIKDFAEQYSPLTIRGNPDCHDRFIILDYGKETEKVYHCGASSKDAGKKVCAINQILNISVMKEVVEKLLKQPEVEV